MNNRFNWEYDDDDDDNLDDREDEMQNEDDFDFAYKDVKVVVDSMSMQYLQGASIDYKEDLMGASFVINNPQAQTTCGCGSSFSI